MYKAKFGFLLGVALVSIVCAACTPFARNPAPVAAVPLANKVDLSNVSLVKQKLNSQYSGWQGVPYRGGGMSKQGVDCSAFVYLTYRQQLGVELPRTSQLQAGVGQMIGRDQLRPGDLVFFRTQLLNHHVGIYMGGERFMHVSSKKGVMISGMNDYYWANKFIQARRLN